MACSGDQARAEIRSARQQQPVSTTRSYRVVPCSLASLLAPCHCCHRRAAGTVVGAAPIVNARTGGARGRVRTYARAGHKDGDLIHRPEARHGSVLTPARALPRRRATARGHSPARRKRRRPCLSLSLSLSVPSALASCSVIAPRRAGGNRPRNRREFFSLETNVRVAGRPVSMSRRAGGLVSTPGGRAAGRARHRDGSGNERYPDRSDKSPFTPSMERGGSLFSMESNLPRPQGRGDRDGDAPTFFFHCRPSSQTMASDVQRAIAACFACHRLLLLLQGPYNC